MRLDYIAPQDHEIFALDSTTISCSLKLMSWAQGKYSKGAVKMHTLIDLRGSIPTFIHITDGRCHDSNVLDLLNIVPGAIYTMDKAYVDFEALNRIDSRCAFFVTRAKELRLIKFCDPETGELLTFISNLTNELEFNGLEIANIYRHRWDIESFFKLIKQNLTVKHLLGCSENAVKMHL
jgi:IS4 transposase